MKDILASTEQLDKANEETKLKLSEEIAKHDKLIAGMLEVNERLSLKEAKMLEDVAAVETQDQNISELQALIESEQRVVDE